MVTERGVMPVDPSTPMEWQETVVAAHVLLAVAAARFYGLIEGAAGVDVDRCEAILARGAELGYLPAPDAIERFVGAMVVGEPA